MNLIKPFIIITVILNGLTHLPETCYEALRACEDEYFGTLRCGPKVESGEKDDYVAFHVYEPKWVFFYGQERLMRIQERQGGNKKRRTWLDQRIELESLDHPNLLKFVKHQIDQVGWFEVLELPVGKKFLSVYQKDKNVFKNPVTLLILFKQIVKSIDYLHQKGFVHRFLDAEFILYDNIKNEIKIMNHEYMTKMKVVTNIGEHFRYWPPETMAAFDKQIEEGVWSENIEYIYDREFDCYCLGVILYYLTQKLRLPFWEKEADHYFYHKNFLTPIGKITAFKKGKFKIDESTDGVIAYLMNGLMLGDPKKRWTTKKALYFIEYVLQLKLYGRPIEIQKLNLYSMPNSLTFDVQLSFLFEDKFKKETKREII